MFDDDSTGLTIAGELGMRRDSDSIDLSTPLGQTTVCWNVEVLHDSFIIGIYKVDCITHISDTTPLHQFIVNDSIEARVEAAEAVRTHFSDVSEEWIDALKELIMDAWKAYACDRPHILLEFMQVGRAVSGLEKLLEDMGE